MCSVGWGTDSRPVVFLRPFAAAGAGDRQPLLSEQVPEEEENAVEERRDLSEEAVVLLMAVFA